MTDVTRARTLVEDVVARAQSGIDATDVYSVASRSGLPDPASVRALAVGLVAEVLVRGLVVVRDTARAREPVRTAEAIGQIAHDWFARADPRIAAGEVAFLTTTPRGAELGDAVLARERRATADGAPPLIHCDRTEGRYGPIVRLALQGSDGAQYLYDGLRRLAHSAPGTWWHLGADPAVRLVAPAADLTLLVVEWLGHQRLYRNNDGAGFVWTGRIEDWTTDALLVDPLIWVNGHQYMTAAGVDDAEVVVARDDPPAELPASEGPSLVEEMVVHGQADWVDAGEVYSIALRCGLTDPTLLRALSVGLVAEALTRGLMVPGDIGDGGHRPWPLSTAEAIARVAEDWFSRANPKLHFGEVGWLSNTPAGAELGDAVNARWYPEQPPDQ